MWQKLVIGLLSLTVVGSVGVGLYDAAQTTGDDTTAQVLAQSAVDAAANSPAVQPVANEQPAQGDRGNPLQIAPTPTPVFMPDAQQPQPVQQQSALDMVGTPWTATGTITGIETNGVTVILKDGSSIFVELGPSDFWQSQATLMIGDAITINGFYNGEQYHAATVVTGGGSVLELRSETGLPLWAGGSAGQNTGETAGNGWSGASTAQVAPEEWITVAGTVTAVDASTLTMQTQTGEMLTMQLGSASFVQEQGVTFAPGDAISVLGFWQGTEFRAGDITKLATGERLMLLDPNGRPLWGGPGRAGNGGGGQGQSGQGGGQGGQGGQGQGQAQNQGIQVPANQWETIQGYITIIEPLAVSLVLPNGQTGRVLLGEFDFWTPQGINFTYGETIQVEGFWLNGEFHAGTVRFVQSGYEMTIRDQTGRLLWADSNAVAQSGGGYRGGRNDGGTTGQTGGSGYRGGRQ